MCYTKVMPNPHDNGLFIIEQWGTQVRKGLLEFSILSLLATRELYGYDVVKQLTKVKGLGITEGTIYPLLSRLRRQGLLKARLEESSSGPARKYYSLTEHGEAMHSQMKVCWHDLVHGMAHLGKQEGSIDENLERKRPTGVRAVS